MRIRVLAMQVMAMIVVAGSTGTAMSLFRGDPEVKLNGKLNCPSIGVNGGHAYLQVSIVTGGGERADRQRLDLAVVLDRSGSMGDEGKIQNARAALRGLIDRLNPEDIFSLVIYDDVVEVIRPAGRVGDKEDLRHIVDRIYPRGSTNLGGGMSEGFAQAARFACMGYVNRVVLLSDGLANRGIIDPGELERIARRYRNQSISLTSMGVGLEYNENLMMGLAENGGGNYYFIESSRDLASILRNEFRKISCVLAQNGRIELTLGRGVRVSDVVGCEGRHEGDRYEIPVGDLYADDRREYTVELEIPEGSGTSTVVRGCLVYDTELADLGHPAFTASVRYTHDVAEVERNRDMETQARADIALSTRAVDQALKDLDEGKKEEAATAISAAKEALAASPALNSTAGAGLRAQSMKLEGYSANVNDRAADSRRVKKAIQYDNYQTQHQK